MTICRQARAGDELVPPGQTRPDSHTGPSDGKPVLSVVRADVPATNLPDSHTQDVSWEPPVAWQRRTVASWDDYMAMARRVVGRFHGLYRIHRFEYQHPTRLQSGTARRLRKPYGVSVAYSEWGAPDAPVVICCGGVANVATRFHYLANDLCAGYRVICMDWLGRGRSGWLAAETDYSLATYAEQLRQMILHLGDRPVTVVGSSMGGSAALALMARQPGLIDRLILNDVGPHIPAARRKRRAEAIARHYVFRSPAELMRKVGASGKNDGPVPEEIRFNLTFHQTRWSDEENGRVYRHDVRAMQAYRVGAHRSLAQWAEWKRVDCPVLLIHGMQSDALNEATIRRMRRGKDVVVMRVPDTGHTPLLADRNQISFMRDWLDGQRPAGSEWSVLHARLREPFPGKPVPLAPIEALR